MRASVRFKAPPPVTTTIQSPPSPQNHTSLPHSAWHSPVPYLFGGLAAMVGLIAFALLILACSYWKLSGYLEGGDDVDNREDNGTKDSTSDVRPDPCFEQRIVVIMAGDDKPTFLATPISSWASSFGDKGNCSDDGKRADSNGKGNGGLGGKKVVESGERVDLSETGSSTAEEEPEGGNDQYSQRHEQ